MKDARELHEKVIGGPREKAGNPTPNASATSRGRADSGPLAAHEQATKPDFNPAAVGPAGGRCSEPGPVPPHVHLGWGERLP